MKKHWALLLLAASLWPHVSAVADGDHDHHRARRALEAGEILPLQTLLERVAQDFSGQVIEVELEHKDTLWVYELKLLQQDGMLLKLKLNARDGSLLKFKRRPAKRKGDD